MPDRSPPRSPGAALTRRIFLKLLAGCAALPSLLPRTAWAADRLLEIHRATRNTIGGAIGRKLFASGKPPAPTKTYPTKARIALPAMSAARGRRLTDAVRAYKPAIGFDDAAISLKELARILYFANGVTATLGSGASTKTRRAAPSAGALYAGELYVVAERVTGLEAGVYHYGVHDHQLARIRSGSVLEELRPAFEAPAAVDGAAAFVVVTNVFGRYQARYANRGYRYALIDTGHIGENLRLATVSAGLAESRPRRFRDDLINGLLEVDGRSEAACAVHAVGRPTARRDTDVRRTNPLVELQYERDLPASLPITQRYHEATKLVPGEQLRPAPPTPRDGARPAAEEIALPRAQPAPAMPVEQSILERRSPKSFRKTPIELAQLGAARELTSARASWGQRAAGTLYVVANAVTGLQPGLYEYVPDQHRLALVRGGDLRGSMVRACLGQDKAGDAAAGFVMIGRLAETRALGGDRAYRDLLIIAGEIGERVYLAAEALGLSARNLAAFTDDRVNELAGLDGEKRAVVHLTMFGHGE